MEKMNAFWIKFLKSTGRGPEITCREYFHFGLQEEAAEKLLAYLLAGTLCAAPRALKVHKKKSEKDLQTGDFCVVTDYSGIPKGVICIKNVWEVGENTEHIPAITGIPCPELMPDSKSAAVYEEFDLIFTESAVV